MTARRLASALLPLLLGSALAAQERTIAVGQSATAELTDSDPTSRGRRAPYHLWTLEGRRGQRVTVDLIAQEFDPYLVVRDEAGYTLGRDDDGGEGTNSRLRTVLPRDGRYSVVVTGFHESSRGRYTLTISGWEAPEAPAAGAEGSIAVGEGRPGVLEPGDAIAGDGPFEDRWTLEATDRQRLSINLRSADFDTYLVLLGPDGRQIASDDDGGEGTDSYIGFRAPGSGRYTIVATAFRDEPRVGAYRLTVAEETGDFAEPGVTAQLGPGETREGLLETGDAEGGRGLEDRWTFQGREGQLVRVDATSSNFDVYAVLRFRESPVDSNDDGGEGTNARLMTVLPGTGEYTLLVSPYSRGSSGGRYRVSLSFAEPPPGSGQVERLREGRRAAGRLEPGDRRRGGGGLQDVWELDGRRGQYVMIEMRSGEFDAYLELRDAVGAQVAENDDGGEGRDALIMTRLPRNGRYTVIARSYGEREATGFYDLLVTSVSDVAAPGRAVALSEGQVLFGRLEAGDSLVGDSTYADLFNYRAPQDGEVTVDLRSSEFDAYLLVQDAEGTTLATDDDGGNGTDSRLTLQVARGRAYRIIANSYGEHRASGSYRISLSARAR